MLFTFTEAGYGGRGSGARMSSANTFPSASCSDTTTGVSRLETPSTILKASSAGIISDFSALPQQPSCPSIFPLFDREATVATNQKFEKKVRAELTACLAAGLGMTFKQLGRLGLHPQPNAIFSSSLIKNWQVYTTDLKPSVLLPSCDFL